MAVKKAILVTKTNAETVLQSYEMGGWEADDIVGYYLVASFGSAMDWSLLTKAAYNTMYVETGKQLENEYVEVEHR